MITDGRLYYNNIGEFLSHLLVLDHYLPVEYISESASQNDFLTFVFTGGLKDLIFSPVVFSPAPDLLFTSKSLENSLWIQCSLLFLPQAFKANSMWGEAEVRKFPMAIFKSASNWNAYKYTGKLLCSNYSALSRKSVAWHRVCTAQEELTPGFLEGL